MRYPIGLLKSKAIITLLLIYMMQMFNDNVLNKTHLLQKGRQNLLSSAFYAQKSCSSKTKHPITAIVSRVKLNYQID